MENETEAVNSLSLPKQSVGGRARNRQVVRNKLSGSRSASSSACAFQALLRQSPMLSRGENVMPPTYDLRAFPLQTV